MEEQEHCSQKGWAGVAQQSGPQPDETCEHNKGLEWLPRLTALAQLLEEKVQVLAVTV